MGSAWSRLDARQRSTIWTGTILGVGLMRAIDSIIFHQLLQWHNFYYDTSDFRRIVSDGVLQAFTAGMLFFGTMRLWVPRRRISDILTGTPLWTGVFFGAGALQLFDGVVNHKILRLHQAREGVDNNLPYDIAWNGFAIGVLLIEWILFRSLSTDHSGNGYRRTLEAFIGSNSLEVSPPC